MRRLALLLALPLIVVTAAPPPSADAQQPGAGACSGSPSARRRASIRISRSAFSPTRT